MQAENLEGQESIFDRDSGFGKTSSALSQVGGTLKRVKKSLGRIFKKSSKRSSKLKNHTFMLLDLRPGAGNMLGAYWEYDPPWLGSFGTPNTSECPKDAVECSLWQILQATAPSRYSLSQTACLGILRRAACRGKSLPPLLEAALRMQAGLDPPAPISGEAKAYHINQRNEGIDLDGVSGALMATQNLQMQTFITNPGSSQSGPQKQIAFAANQRDEVRDLHDVAGALQAHPGIKQQTFVAGFSAGAGASAGTIGYQEGVSPTLKGSPSGNCMPSILCINDQGGQIMECSENITGTFRAQEHGHQPLVLRPGKPLLYENYGIDSRYTGPHKVAPTLSARMGTGGLNTSLVQQVPEEVICIAGNAIDRQPQNGGNGFGWQRDISYTLTTSDRHSVYARQRVDQFKDDDVASTESARQHKDATDLVCQPPSTWDADCRNLIRRLTPLECERLQGYPDGWTDVPGASDSARYKALGNSVAIPCVEYLMQRVAMVITLDLEWDFSLALVIAFALAFGYLGFTIKKIGGTAMAEKTRNLCAQIPVELHDKVRQRQAESGETLSRYITALITKFYEMEERQTMEKEVTRPVCVQVPVELFEQFKAYLKQHGMTQKDFVIHCIRQALAEDTGAAEE